MKKSKICNCHASSDKKLIKSKINRSFCDKCGCVILKDDEENIFYTLKSKQKRLFFDFSPISIIKNMKKKTEENYPFIYKEFNINFKDKMEQEKVLRSINIYLKHRKMLLLKLQKLIQIFDYCDLVFYQCLFYLDTYLSHNLTEDISERTLLYYLIGFFLCSCKFKETDIYEPLLDSFYDLSKGSYFSIDKIKYYEVVCLKMINYNVFSYSAYDWIMQLMSNGIIFNCEIDKDNEMILIKGHRHYITNAINKYVLKLLLDITSKYLFFKYAPMYLAFSLIRIAREKYLDKNMIKPKLFKLLVKAYGINHKDFKSCYNEIKSEMIENNSQEKYKIKINKEEQNEDDKNKNETKDELESFENIERGRKTSFHQFKNVYVPKINRSSNALIHIINNEQQTNNTNNNDSKNEINGEKLKEKESISKNDDRSNNKFLTKKEDNIPKIKSKFHLAIDCSNKINKSRDNLPYVNINDNRESRNSFLTMELTKFGLDRSQNYPLNKIKLKANIKNSKNQGRNRYKSSNKMNKTKFDSFEKEKEKEKIKPKSKFYSNQNIINLKNVMLMEISNKKLQNNKLPKISAFDEFNL